MTVFTLSVIYLGTHSDYDPVDGNATAGDISGLLGTYYGPGNAASDNIVILTAQDDNNDDLVNSNDHATPEGVSYDLGDGLVSTQYDSLFNVQTTVTFAPSSGQPDYNGLGGIIQTETGDLFFVMLDDDAGLGANAFDDSAIQSISINSVDAFGSQQAATYSDTQSFVPCFTTGTRIKTPKGDIRVEALRVGDHVLTVDNSEQPIVWIGRKALSPSTLLQHPNLAPICIKKGALGLGHPNRDLLVSPQHHLALSSKIVKRMTGETEIIVPAVKLLCLPGVDRVHAPLGVQYYHFACANHELIWANNTPTETLFFGPQVKASLDPVALQELKHILPELLCNDVPLTKHLVRSVFGKPDQLQRLVTRHIKNNQSLVAPMAQEIA